MCHASAYFIYVRHQQEAFKVPLVVQLTDDEKFLFKPELKLEEVRGVAIFCSGVFVLSLLCTTIGGFFRV